MCLILFAYKAVPGVPLLVAANRDEWFSRPAAPAAFWNDHPEVLAGRDLQAGGTWMGISSDGRFAALTNFRSPDSKRPDAPSRGDLVRAFLTGSDSAQSYLNDLARRAADYNGFCLLAGDANKLLFFSNRAEGLVEVSPGIHGLSNHLLDTPWPKVVKGRNGLTQLVRKPFRAADFLDLMDDSVPVAERDLPQAGSKPDESSLSSMRIMKGNYGTRCSTVLRISDDGDTVFAERTYRLDGDIEGEVSHSFRVRMPS